MEQLIRHQPFWPKISLIRAAAAATTRQQDSKQETSIIPFRSVQDRQGSAAVPLHHSTAGWSNTVKE